MLVSESSAMRYKIWQGIRARQIDSMKEKIRRLYIAEEEREVMMMGRKEGKERKGCEMCEMGEIGVEKEMDERLVREVMLADGRLCRQHQKQLISHSLSLCQHPQFLPSLYHHISIEQISLPSLRRALLLLSQLLLLPSINEQAISQCKMVGYILDGWVDYRLSELVREQGWGEFEVGVVRGLLRVCRNGIVVRALGVVVGVEGRFGVVGELVDSVDSQERSIGLNAILSLLHNPTQLPHPLKPYLSTLILSSILHRTLPATLLHHPQHSQLQLEILYQCLTQPNQQLNIGQQKQLVRQWIERRVKLGCWTFSGLARQRVQGVMGWLGDRMEDEG